MCSKMRGTSEPMVHTMPSDIYAEIREGLLQTGPARLEFTRKAFRMIPRMEKPRILDVGCGEGGPTLELARLSDGEVVALDIHQPSLDRLTGKIARESLSGRVHVIRGSLFAMGFLDESFDIVWSEGSIHIIGFERGLLEWLRLIRPGGVLVVHEVAWPQSEPPRELREFWQERWHDIRTASGYSEAIRASGYALTGQFNVPEDLWGFEYFGPLEGRIRLLREKYAQDREVLAFLDREQREVDLYGKYPQWYVSAFFVLQKPDDLSSRGLLSGG